MIVSNVAGEVPCFFSPVCDGPAYEIREGTDVKGDCVAG
jgi:hypothetical protein